MRQDFPAKVKDAAFKRSGGLCEGFKENGERCGLPLQPGRMTYDHINPDWMGGEPTLENCQLLGWCCDKPKTAGDQKVIAKVKRVARRHNSIKSRASRPLPGGRESEFKKKVSGEIVRR